MSWYQLALLALIQGATEWLPVSSSAHLFLLPALTDFPDQGPLIDAMAHLGSLGAVLVYFRRDIARLLQGVVDLIVGRPGGERRVRFTPEAKLLLLIALATPPGLAAGALYALTDLKDAVRTTEMVAAATIGFGALLWAADEFGKRTRTEAQMTFRDALMIGAAQMLAFLPGASRSGVAMTAARALGFEREEAARFGMLVGVPLIAASGLFALLQLATSEHVGAVADNGELIPVTLWDGAIVAGLSFFAAWASIAFLMALLQRMSFLPFVLYRFALGAALILFAT